MRIINKADKYGEENDDYTLMIGDADIVLMCRCEIHKTDHVVWAWNFQTEMLQGHRKHESK